MRLFLSLILIITAQQFSFAQKSVYKVSYTTVLSDEIMDELKNREIDENDEDVSELLTLMNSISQGKPVIEVWVDQDYYRLASILMPGQGQIVDKKQQKAIIVNHEDSTYFSISTEALFSFANGASSEDPDGLNFKYIDGASQMIAGFPCKKAVLMYGDSTPEDAEEDAEISMEVWYTEKIPAFTIGSFNNLSTLPGGALKISINGVDFVANKIIQEKVADGFFNPPANFQEIEATEAETADMPSEIELGEGLIAYYDDESTLYGLKTEDDQIITQPLYTHLSEIRDGAMIAINTDYQAGLIDAKGKTVLAFNYDSINYDETKQAYQFSKDDQMGLMDKTGKNLWGKTFDYLGEFNGNYALYMENELSGLIDLTGKIIVPASYESILQYDDNYFIVLGEEKSKVFEVKTNKLKFEGFQEIYLAGENLFIASHDGEKYGYVDTNGKTVIPFNYSMATPFYEGHATVMKLGDEEPIIIDTKGQVIHVTE